VPRPSRQGVLVLAETTDGPVAGAAAATAVVQVEADRPVLSRLRVPIIVTAALLLVATAVLEWRHLRALRAAAVPPAV
jgi:hypothetical protein